MEYIKTIWKDHIVGANGEIIQQGTPLEETRLNHIEEGIHAVTEAVKSIKVPPATINEPGIAQLSNETNSSAEDKAATPKAVKTVNEAAMAAQTTANAANLTAGAVGTEVDTHVNLTTAHGAVSTATANRMIVRDASGRAKVAAPSASDDIAIKSTVDNAVGTLSTLKTTAKTNAVAAINELFQSASDGKTAVAAAITGKGVPASGSDTFTQLAQKIGQIAEKKYAVFNWGLMGGNTYLNVDLGFEPNAVFAYGTANNSAVLAVLFEYDTVYLSRVFSVIATSQLTLESSDGTTLNESQPIPRIIRVKNLFTSTSIANLYVVAIG